MKSASRKIWMVSEHYFPCGNTTSYLICKICEGLAESSNINVITNTSNNSRKECINGVLIHRAGDTSLDKNKFSERILRLMLLSLRLFRKSAQLIKREDIVFVVTNPAPIIFLMGFLKRFIGFRLCFIVHDLFPENLVVAGVTTSRNILYKLTLKLFNYAYRKADRIVVIGRDMKETMESKLDNYGPLIEYIPNFADTDTISHQAKKTNKLALREGLTGKFVVLFTGNIGWAQDIENILKAMKLLLVHPHIHLLMIGEGAKFKMAQEFIRNNSLTNITLLPSISRDNSNLFLNAGDVGLVSLQRGRKGIGIPSKTYSYMAAGKPVVGVVDRDSEVEITIRETKCGWWIEPGNPQKLAELFKQLSQSAEIKSKGIIARNIAKSHYSIQSTIPLFYNLIKELTDEYQKQSLVQG